ncbi:MAG: anti-sigma factor [Acidimicrobiales bacterium]
MSDHDNEAERMADQAQGEFELLELLDDIKGRIGNEPTDLAAPPPEVWHGIQRQLDADLVLDTHVSPKLAQTDNVVTSLDHHRRKRRPAGILLGAVAASVVAAIAIGSVLRNNTTIVGEVELATLNDDVSSLGTATIVEADGVTRLDIDFDTGLVGAEDTYELWIIDTDINEMHSLGEIVSTGVGDQRSYEIPPGVDIRDFPIVDISLEPNDGNPAHSGDSHFRGVLDA